MTTIHIAEVLRDTIFHDER